MKYKAQHILVSHEFEARDILKKIKEGVGFEELAKDFSKCPSASHGGHLGSVAKGRMVQAFDKALFALKENEISGVVKTQFGYHIIKRLPFEK